jgi:flagellar hook protein FlgE
MNSVPSIALSGLAAATLRLDVSAHNIANDQTPGYRRQFVLQDSQPGGGVVSSVGRAVDPGTNLAQDLVEQMVASYEFKANLRVVRTHDNMLGSLLDLHA